MTLTPKKVGDTLVSGVVMRWDRTSSTNHSGHHDLGNDQRRRRYSSALFGVKIDGTELFSPTRPTNATPSVSWNKLAHQC